MNTDTLANQIQDNDGYGIFCIEGEWGAEKFIQTSVQPLVESITKNSPWLNKTDPPSDRAFPPVIYRRAATEAELRYLVKRWSQAQRYTIGYIAIHGSPNYLHFSSGFGITLQEFSKLLGNSANGKHMIVSACSILGERDDPNAIREFVEKTGVKSLFCYTQTADWFDCSALDLMILTRLMDHGDAEKTFDELKELCSGLITKYGLTYFATGPS